MNKTHWEHAVFAALMYAAVYVLSANALAGACFAGAFFLGREHAQREYQLTGGGPVGGLKPWAGFDVWRWTTDAQLDLLFPVVAVTGLFWVMR